MRNILLEIHIKRLNLKPTYLLQQGLWIAFNASTLRVPLLFQVSTLTRENPTAKMGILQRKRQVWCCGLQFRGWNTSLLESIGGHQMGDWWHRIDLISVKNICYLNCELFHRYIWSILPLIVKLICVRVASDLTMWPNGEDTGRSFNQV